jgi:predicted RND superfamily exporter protein
MHSETLEVEIDLPADGEILQPGVLEAIENSERSLSSIAYVRKVESILTLVRRVNRMLHGDDAAFDHLASTAQGNAELVELISLSKPDLLRTWISFDNRSLRLSVTVEAESSVEDTKQLIRSAIQRISDSVPSTWGLLISGEVAIQRDWVRDVQQTQFRSFPSSFVLVLGMLIAFFRSFALAAAATVPTLLPVVVTLGGMGWIGMSLDISRTMIAAIVVGIGVDHSIHLLRNYQLRRRAGGSVEDAMREALIETGRPIVITTIALALGFLTLLASAWQTISSFGFLVAASMVGAMLTTIFVVPALIFFAARISKGARR